METKDVKQKRENNRRRNEMRGKMKRKRRQGQGKARKQDDKRGEEIQEGGEVQGQESKGRK